MDEVQKLKNEEKMSKKGKKSNQPKLLSYGRVKKNVNNIFVTEWLQHFSNGKKLTVNGLLAKPKVKKDLTTQVKMCERELHPYMPEKALLVACLQEIEQKGFVKLTNE